MTVPLPPLKKRKLDDDLSNSGAEFLREMRHEVDVEIGLRARLAETIESRITWALLLQKSLLEESTHEPEDVFKDAAFEALQAVEAPSEILYNREEIILPDISILTELPVVKTRPPPKEKPTTRSKQSKDRFLYLGSPDTSILVLQCPACFRINFGTLQALFNHATMGHGIEWGSHEECIAACASAEPAMRGDLDLEAGSSVEGQARPGVRSLFQMAVEGTRNGNEDGLHLTRTLGLHGDTPALAAFLGKVARRKIIKAYDDEDEEVDVDTLSESAARIWRTPRPRRNEPAEESQPLTLVGEEVSATKDSVTASGLPLAAPATTRFHISARVVVTDRSLTIPPEQRVSDHTHMWMLSVESPSYSYDITTILKCLSVQVPASEHPLITSEPPFLVKGTCDAPFLAKIELQLNGYGEQLQTVLLEHWVALDIEIRKNPVVGSEQTVDVDLDKRTAFMSPKAGYLPASSRAHWVLKTVPSQQKPKGKGYEQILAELLPKFPMTVKANNRRAKASTVPYPLKSANELKSMLMGRKKSIEWGRAAALRQAYEEHRDSESPLTTGDVYAWLTDEGHFFRDAPAVPSVDSTSKKPKQEDSFCGTCGLRLGVHPSIAKHGLPQDFHCDIFPSVMKVHKLPVIDVRTLTPATKSELYLFEAVPRQLGDGMLQFRSEGTPWKYSCIVAHADSVLALSVHRLASRIQSLRCIPRPLLPPFTPPKAEAEAQVAPYALLALATRQFIRLLVQEALVVSTRDKDLAVAFGWLKRQKGKQQQPRMLTPMHVLSGIANGRERSSKLALVLSRIGIGCDDGVGTSSSEAVPRQSALALPKATAPSTLHSVKHEHFGD